MLFNRFISLATLLSVAASALAAPLPLPRPGDFELEAEVGKTEVEIEKEGHCYEIELEHKSSEAEIEYCLSHGHPKRGADNLSLAGSITTAQMQLGVLKPQIEVAMLGPLGSIEKTVGPLMGQVHATVESLNGAMSSFTGMGSEVLYRNPSGGSQLSETDLAKSFSNCLLTITEIEELVQHVSGFKVTSAQKNIREDLLLMKKTLGVIAPGILNETANNMAMALSIGTW